MENCPAPFMTSDSPWHRPPTEAGIQITAIDPPPKNLWPGRHWP
ncbi:uncharacterized protein METZ01_LOCUS188318 [marine metagenome]|uniref:Uncharacterized protein n=1 Tax=marine metagenome TaxID=408172 RepID=A0A382DBU8_9ZZZZ